MPTKTLTDILGSQNNSFNAVRLVAAGAVFVSHSVLLLPFGDHLQPFSGTPYDLGQIAVNVFFFLSGMMLSRSYDLRPDPFGFAWARTVRVFPGLVVCGMVTAWVIGPFNTSLPQGAYFADIQTLLYPFSVPLLFNSAELPGIFAFGPEPFAVNVPLWTVKYELIAYGVFATLAAARLVPKGRLLALATVLLGLALAVTSHFHALDHGVAGSLLRFGFCFALGTLAYGYRDRIPLSPAVALAGLAASVPLLFTPLGPVASIVGTAYLAVVLGGMDFGAPGRWTRRHDLSYGIYLYAWPIQQMLISRFAQGPLDAIGWSLAAAALTVGLATLSWFFVERPALGFKHRPKPAAPVVPAE